MKNKFAGILNILCGLISIVIYFGFFFTFVMDQMQGEGIVDCLMSVFLGIIGGIPLAFLMFPAFLMFIVGREMISSLETIRTEKLLTGITIFIKILLCLIWGVVGWIFFMRANAYFSTYAILLLLGAVLIGVSWVVDVCALIKDKIGG